MARRKIIPREELDMRALVLSEASSFFDAAQRLTELGYPTTTDAIGQWARKNPKYVPPVTLDRLFQLPQRRKAPPVRTPTPPERKPGPVTVKPLPETPAEFGQQIIDAMVAMKSRMRALEEQLADKNQAVVALVDRVNALSSQAVAMRRDHDRERAAWEAAQSTTTEAGNNGFAEQLAELIKVKL